MQYLSKFLLVLIFLNIIYSQMTPFHKWWSYLLELKPYSVITIVAMLTYQSTQESLTICFFIIFYLNIVIDTQTVSRYLVGYLPVKSTKELLEN